jgi:hypothetical protein
VLEQPLAWRSAPPNNHLLHRWVLLLLHLLLMCIVNLRPATAKVYLLFLAFLLLPFVFPPCRTTVSGFCIASSWHTTSSLSSA